MILPAKLLRPDHREPRLRRRGGGGSRLSFMPLLAIADLPLDLVYFLLPVDNFESGIIFAPGCTLKVTRDWSCKFRVGTLLPYDFPREGEVLVDLPYTISGLLIWLLGGASRAFPGRMTCLVSS